MPLALSVLAGLVMESLGCKMTIQKALGPPSFCSACPRKLGAWNDYKKQYNDSLMKNMIFFKQITGF